jgi:hypothetical protein
LISRAVPNPGRLRENATVVSVTTVVVLIVLLVNPAD